MEDQTKTKLTVPKGGKYNSVDDCKDLIVELNSFTNLEILELSGASFGLDACKLISENLNKHNNIKIANFADMFTGKKSDEIPFAVKHLMDALKDKQVSSLDWSDNAFGPNGIRGFIDYMVGNQVCVHLNINNTGLGQEGGRLVASGLLGFTLEKYDNTKPETPHIPVEHCKLESLKSGRGRLEDPGCIALSEAFEKMKTLKVLYLPQSGITPKGMVVLAKALRQNLDLEELNLYDNNIGPKGASEMFETIKLLKKLKILNLGDCMLTKKEVAILVEILKSVNTLEELDLSYDGVNDIIVKGVVQIIENNPNLMKLNLNGNCLTDKGINSVKNALEKVQKGEALMTLSDNETESEEESEDGDDSKGSDDELAEAMAGVKI
jgi:Ran GTPase-activating protein 1